MLTLARARQAAGQAGELLPTAFKQLAREGVHIRRGQLALIASGPGVGKSAFSLALAIRASVPTLYVSADSDAPTQYTRAVAMLTGTSVTEIGERTEEEKIVHYDTTVNRLDFLRWDFSGQVTLDDINGEMLAYAYLYGCWPHLLVIDNLSNIWTETEGYQGYEETMDFLHDLARRSGTAVVVLHHVTGSYNDGGSPVPLSGLKGQIGRVPELILTLHKGGGLDFETLNVNPVKNRSGRADPSGGWFIPLVCDLEYMRIG